MKFPVPAKIIRFNWKIKRALVSFHESGGCVKDFLEVHDISRDEFESWIARYNLDGNRGLMITKRNLA